MSTRTRLQTIFAQVVHSHLEGMSRDAVIAEITKDFGIAKEITAVTYYNDAIRLNGLSVHKARGPRKVTAPVQTVGFATLAQAAA